ncbi:hypothetical protein M413DRAFT_242031 [Hebeloma cylindrosporum]|uniref:Uncharacterized protein n=1 Tax=Hebeloma cylindrosporum TaxID=76867 RepID=A0A0C2XL35_HEBCY|nr:hypothetical protein M413DRAFT_242031 [Hebeloma cylindrosporum h7]
MVDGVLRQHPWAQDSPIYPAFQVRREIVGYNLNPYLVILAAEIKFRRYNAANGPALPPPYDTLMRKTLEVADLLYFQPVVNRDASSVQFAIVNVDVDSRYAQDKPLDSDVASLMEFGVRTGAEGESGGSTARQRQPAAGTRRKDADYWRHLMSGRGAFHLLSCLSLLIESRP